MPQTPTDGIQAYVESSGITQYTAVAVNGGLHLPDGPVETATYGLYGLEYLDAGARHRVYVLHADTMVLPIAIDRNVPEPALSPSQQAEHQRALAELRADTERWHPLCAATDPRLVDDPHYPALAAALTRAEQAGTDVPKVLGELAIDLPGEHPGRALHNRLISINPAALTTPFLRPPAPPASDHTARTTHPAPPPPARPPTPRR